MTSIMAKEDIEQMISQGLKPTVEDIIKLNALGLKFESAKNRYSTSSLFMLPRVAYLSEKLTLRQPTIGHEIWMNSVKRFLDENNLDTLLILHAYALSRDHEKLPDCNDKEAVKNSIEDFMNVIREYTHEQLFAAIDYVKNGCDSLKMENPESLDKEDDNGNEVDETEDWNVCIAAGCLYNGVSILYGQSIADLKKLTHSQLQEIITKSIQSHQIYDSSKNAGMNELGEYNETLDFIRERLKKENIKEK